MSSACNLAPDLGRLKRPLLFTGLFPDYAVDPTAGLSCFYRFPKSLTATGTTLALGALANTLYHTRLVRAPVRIKGPSQDSQRMWYSIRAYLSDVSHGPLRHCYGAAWAKDSREHWDP